MFTNKSTLHLHHIAKLTSMVPTLHMSRTDEPCPTGYSHDLCLISGPSLSDVVGPPGYRLTTGWASYSTLNGLQKSQVRQLSFGNSKCPALRLSISNPVHIFNRSSRWSSKIFTRNRQHRDQIPTLFLKMRQLGGLRKFNGVIDFSIFCRAYMIGTGYSWEKIKSFYHSMIIITILIVLAVRDLLTLGMQRDDMSFPVQSR